MLTAYIFLIGYFGACTLALVRHPVFGLVAYLAAFYLHPPTRWWSFAVPDLRWSLLAAGVTFVGLLLHKREQTGRPLRRSSPMIGMVLLIGWLAVQSSWALDSRMHYELLDYYIKFAIAMALIYKCIETESHLKIFLWTHVLGCFAFGWDAFFGYSGGRFENYGGPGFADANFAGIQSVTGIFAAATLFLAGNLKERVSLMVVAPFIVNGLITTLSRSSFLALICGGLAFIWYCPSRFRLGAAVLGAAGLVGFLSLTHEAYWERIGTIRYAGESLEGVDTGSARLVVWGAQMEMFAEQPLTGCGHRCTATLSPAYLDDSYLTGPEDNRARSSHNTFLTLLVEQGILGGALYVLFLAWLIGQAVTLKRQLKDRRDSLPGILPGVVAILASIVVADVFVDYLKLEVRLWYVALMLVLVKLRECVPMSRQMESVAAPQVGPQGSTPPRRHRRANARRWPTLR